MQSSFWQQLSIEPIPFRQWDEDKTATRENKGKEEECVRNVASYLKKS